MSLLLFNIFNFCLLWQYFWGFLLTFYFRCSYHLQYIKVCVHVDHCKVIKGSVHPNDIFPPYPSYLSWYRGTHGSSSGFTCPGFKRCMRLRKDIIKKRNQTDSLQKQCPLLLWIIQRSAWGQQQFTWCLWIVQSNGDTDSAKKCCCLNFWMLDAVRTTKVNLAGEIKLKTICMACFLFVYLCDLGERTV